MIYISHKLFALESWARKIKKVDDVGRCDNKNIEKFWILACIFSNLACASGKSQKSRVRT